MGDTLSIREVVYCTSICVAVAYVFFCIIGVVSGWTQNGVNMQNVTIVVNGNMCNGCCECIGACSANNICIMMSKAFGHPIPFISDADCTHCGDCVRACPQAPVLKQNPA